eukprot:scaffold12231_cov103-Isochrysis_galbana.AAC.2
MSAQKAAGARAGVRAGRFGAPPFSVKQTKSRPAGAAAALHTGKGVGAIGSRVLFVAALPGF